MTTFDAARNRHVRSVALALLPSTTSDGETDEPGAEFVAGPGVIAATLEVTDDTGTSVDVTVETREDAAASWREAGTFTQATAVGSERKTFVVDSRVRVTYTTVGSMTFTVEAVA